MQLTELTAELRDKTGTGVARKLRREGFLPAVLYGKSVDTQCLQVVEKEVDKILRSKLGQNTLINLSLKGGKGQKVIIKDYQGDVLTRRLTHVDFMIVSENQTITVYVPVRIEGKAAGLTQGGLLEFITREVELVCQVGRIPEEIVADVSNLNIGQNVHLSELKLPEGVSYKHDATIAAVYMPREEEAAPVAAAPTDAAAAAAVPATAQKAEGEKAGAAAPAAAGKDAKAAPAKK
jgi:large subunit ribosomal protein L25